MSLFTTIRVLIADDNAPVRRAMSAILAGEADMEVVGEAENGTDAIRKTQELKPDVVLMDIHMPILDGIGATQYITHEKLMARVLMVSQFEFDEYIKRALLSGASGFVMKESLVQDLANAIRLVFSGKRFFTASIAERATAMAFKGPGSGVN